MDHRWQKLIRFPALFQNGKRVGWRSGLILLALILMIGCHGEPKRPDRSGNSDDGNVLGEVVSGSMAPFLSGLCVEIACENCLYSFQCDRLYPPNDGRATCPNCGFHGNVFDHGKRADGTPVVVDSRQLDSLTHWDVVAYRASKKANAQVKRVAGIPGESIEIRSGEIYADGELLRKDFRQQKEMAILVHDSHFRPRPDTGMMYRWGSAASISGWNVDRWPFEFSPSADRMGIDWLYYTHQTSWPVMGRSIGNANSSIETPVVDNYAYNQGLARQLNPVSDLMAVVEFDLDMDSSNQTNGQFAIALHDGFSWVEMFWDLSTETVRVLHSGNQIGSTAMEADLRQSRLVTLSLFDHQVLVAVDDEVIFRQNYAHDLTQGFAPTPSPFRVGASGVKAKTDQLRLYRDVYNLGPSGLDVPWKYEPDPEPPGYFLIGDNVPRSVDSRTSGVVFPRKVLLGEVRK